MVLRITLLNGNSPRGDRSPHERILSALANGQTPSLFTDEYRQTSSAENVAQLIVELIERPNLNGLFHWAGSEVVSRYELGRKILQRFGFKEDRIEPSTLLESIDRVGSRPACLTFELAPLESKVKTQPPHWSNNLKRCIYLLPFIIGFANMSMIQVVTIHDFRMSLFHMSFRKESGAENMATDMWLLAQADSWGGPAFRRYGWTKPQITFGYGQKPAWVEKETGEQITALTRRPTGGGIVRHGTDLTYCLILRKEVWANKCPQWNFTAFFISAGGRLWMNRIYLIV